MCRRAGQAVKNRQAYRVMKEHGHLHKCVRRQAELYQAAKLFELLPSRPNELWQMDVTYNGPSFIARRFNNHLKDRFRQARIRYRKPTQLGLLERFHKTLKEEEIYWRMYDNPEHCRQCLAEFQ